MPASQTGTRETDSSCQSACLRVPVVTVEREGAIQVLVDVDKKYRQSARLLRCVFELRLSYYVTWFASVVFGVRDAKVDACRSKR